MKERILATLLDLSQKDSKDKNIEQILCKALKIDSEELVRRAEYMLHQILFEYGSFDIITLDKFTHRIIRSFSRELQLPYGFEVVLDPSTLLEEAVTSIIDEVGNEGFLTHLLTQFSIDKVRQEQSWNIQKDLDDFASILLNENDRYPLADLKKKTQAEHKEDRIILQNEQRNAEHKIVSIAEETLSLLQENGLLTDDFIRGTLPKHFQKAKKGEYSKLYTNQLEQELQGEKPLYKKGLDPLKKEQIEKIKPQLIEAYISIKEHVGIFLLAKRTLKSLIPQSLLQLIEERLDTLQNKKEVRLLGEFNSKISKLVQDASAPFIYERLGERYQHYFLDEFQDTSQLQWSNLVPLISNALESESLSGEQGSLLLVGDPKQAIYRWRGGDIQQFVSLLNKIDNPFQVQAQIENLEMNYRSGESIVRFNNSFFLSLSECLDAQVFKDIYGAGGQQKSQKEGGYVSIEALPKGGLKEENNALYVAKTLAAVKRALEGHYTAGDIAVLVRKRDQASAIGEGLTQQGYSILSSEALVVKHSKKVQFVLAILRLSIQPNDAVQHKLILDAFWDSYSLPNYEYHTFIKSFVHLSSSSFFKALANEIEFDFSLKKSAQYSILDASEYIMEQFVALLPPTDPFLSAFLEDVFEFSSIQSQTISSYLKYWERQEDKLRIASPAVANAIHVMTIHQAKGLEFPVVILPFMDTALNPNLKDKIWFPFQEGPLSSVQWGWITASKEMELYGEMGKSLYAKHVLSQQLDAVNVLYVALTRAKEQLYIITQESTSLRTSTYSDLFNRFVLQQGKKLDTISPFEWGEFKRNNIKFKGVEIKKTQVNHTVSSHWKKRLVANRTPNAKTRLAQIKGLMVHEILSKVIYADMLNEELEKIFNKNRLTKKNQRSISNTVQKIIEHPMLSRYFERDQSVYCEQDVLVPNGETLRPDRVNLLPDGSAIVIDYKTGKPKKADGYQINEYALIYKDLGFSPVEKVLVYIDDEISVQKI